LLTTRWVMLELLVFSLFVSSGASAYDLPGFTPIPMTKLPVYVQAIQSAVENRVLIECNVREYSRVALPAQFEFSVLGFIKTDTSQPLLALEVWLDAFGRFTDQFHHATSMYRYLFTTSSDYKSILKVSAQAFQKEWVNKGDLINPVMKSEFVLKKTKTDCGVRD
jgi:hypothetical protein